MNDALHTQRYTQCYTQSFFRPTPHTGLWGTGDVRAAWQQQYITDLEAAVHAAVKQLDACYAQNHTNMADLFTQCKVCCLGVQGNNVW